MKQEQGSVPFLVCFPWKTLMTFPIAVQAANGHFTATVLGSPNLRAEGESRAQALERLKAVLVERVQHGELSALSIDEPSGILSLAGKYANDPTLRDICEEAYRARDAELTE
jgi:hypothetical protein